MTWRMCSLKLQIQDKFTNVNSAFQVSLKYVPVIFFFACRLRNKYYVTESIPFYLH